MLKRKIAIAAATESSSAHQSRLDDHRHVERQAVAAHRRGLAEQGVQREPDREVQDHADHRGGDRRQRAGERLVAAQPLDEGRAEEDPEEARREGHPGREQAAERAGQHRRQRAGIAEGGQEADELQHHDQRPGRGLGHAEAVEHLARLQPADSVSTACCAT